jgi:hypothetical protein
MSYFEFLLTFVDSCRFCVEPDKINIQFTRGLTYFYVFITETLYYATYELRLKKQLTTEHD